MNLNPNISITTLNVNKLKTPNKGKLDRFNKKISLYALFTKKKNSQLTPKDTNRLGVKAEKIFTCKKYM